MPLRDHFHSAPNKRHSWDEVHGGWPMMLVTHLASVLPKQFRAAPSVHLGSGLEVDVATFDNLADVPNEESAPSTATLSIVKPTFTVESTFIDDDAYEVLIYDEEYERTLVAVIELISPGNKDRAESRAQFVGKCRELLKNDVSVTLVDLVTTRQRNLFGELLGELSDQELPAAIAEQFLYAATVRRRPSRRQTANVDTWYYPLTLGQPLPSIPIWLGRELGINLDLEISYEQTCQILRIS